MSEIMPENSQKPLNPAAITPEMAAKLLGLPSEIIHKHINEGAPVAADGTMNLIHYAAWLNGRVSHGS
jgi:hypothetical protein